MSKVREKPCLRSFFLFLASFIPYTLLLVNTTKPLSWVITMLFIPVLLAILFFFIFGKKNLRLVLFFYYVLLGVPVLRFHSSSFYLTVITFLIAPPLWLFAYKYLCSCLEYYLGKFEIKARKNQLVGFISIVVFLVAMNFLVFHSDIADAIMYSLALFSPIPIGLLAGNFLWGRNFVHDDNKCNKITTCLFLFYVVMSLSIYHINMRNLLSPLALFLSPILWPTAFMYLCEWLKAPSENRGEAST